MRTSETLVDSSNEPREIYDIKRMKLYSNAKITQTLNTAATLAYRYGDQLVPAHFSGFDQLHYFGMGFVDSVIERSVGDQAIKHSADIGAGLGGPARHIAHKYKWRVTAIELQEEFCRAGNVLNRLQKLCEFVNYKNGDITDDVFSSNFHDTFDLAISQLVFLHIPLHKKLHAFTNCCKILKQSCLMAIEDFFAYAPVSENDRVLLQNDVAVPDGILSSKEEYIQLLENAGFEIISWEDVSADWTMFVWERYEQFLSTVDSAEEIYGKSYRQDISYFYQKTSMLFRHWDDYELAQERFPRAMQAIENPHILMHKPTVGGARILVKRK